MPVPRDGQEVVIDRFSPEDRHAFAALNRAWLSEYGLLEAPDEPQLADPYREIIAAGGQIFVGRRGGELLHRGNFLV